MDDRIYLGETSLVNEEKKVAGSFVKIDNEQFYKISNYSEMQDFFMTIVSDSNHWMFISSNGSLTAGRKNRESSLFPYYSDDKIHDYHNITGSKTCVMVEKADREYLWEPFNKAKEGIYRVERNIYKSIYANKLLFEEINHDLEITFSYSWSFSERFGFIKKSKIENTGSAPSVFKVLDGIQNILPNGMSYSFQNEYSNLSDAYKKNEIDPDTGLGMYMLSSIPVDRAEPSESLIATTVWSYGISNPTILLSSKQTQKFCKGQAVHPEIDVRAARGAYFLNKTMELSAGSKNEWYIVAEVNQHITQVNNLKLFIKDNKDIAGELEMDVDKGTEKLVKIVANSDGIQHSNETVCTARHFANTLYNVMRGGIYLDGYNVDVKDLMQFIRNFNQSVFEKHQDLFGTLPAEITREALLAKVNKIGDGDLTRLCYEYLPLTFSRRHGDPSRPWNMFSIETKNEDGSPKSDFQGNWRDIFQNWEALSLSFPGFIDHIISKFVNASTPDGYNPYRITKNGIDWEAPDPDDPWAYIGYWGDHQIIYLQKLLELSDKYYPGKLKNFLSEDIFAYANVPYRIKAYKDIVKNPQDTIEFDQELNNRIEDLEKEMGADARLLLNEDLSVYKVNLTEKILVTLLSKLSNFIPEAGIWLNTQRPEWNDANNALVGNGVSMVTLYYIRRFVKFWLEQLKEASPLVVSVSAEVKTLLEQLNSNFDEHKKWLEPGFSDEARKVFTDKAGIAGEAYRNSIYQNGFSGSKEKVVSDELISFLESTLDFVDQSIAANKRDDGLYHAYNLISFRQDKAKIRYLYEMLEGQVAVLSAGSLSPEESLSVLDSLKDSALFREDQFSYILYPDRQLPRFEDKNNIPADKIKQSKLLQKMLKEGDTSILSKDLEGQCHFHGDFRNAAVLKEKLESISDDELVKLVKSEKELILDIYEEMFDHQSFTGRSGTFYGYEGLGSIYWHMVSKLLLATEESFFAAVNGGASAETIGRLKAHYYEIKAGLGLYKSPELYGAFPTDAYSHTPGGAGVKQPGMTGQVKEDLISRLGELGISIEKGKIHFDVSLINKQEFLEEDSAFIFYDAQGEQKKLMLKKGQLAFTLCQTPVLLSEGETEQIVITYSDGKEKVIPGGVIDSENSAHVFARDGLLEKITYEVSI